MRENHDRGWHYVSISVGDKAGGSTRCPRTLEYSSCRRRQRRLTIKNILPNGYRARLSVVQTVSAAMMDEIHSYRCVTTLCTTKADEEPLRHGRKMLLDVRKTGAGHRGSKRVAWKTMRSVRTTMDGYQY